MVRLVDTGVQNIGCLRSMAQVRRYYAALVPEAQQFFGSERDDIREALAFLAVGREGLAELFTIATMIAVVNSVVGSTGVSMLFVHFIGGFDQQPSMSVGLGVLVGLMQMTVFVIYQHRRYQAVVPFPPPTDPEEGKNDRGTR